MLSIDLLYLALLPAAPRSIFFPIPGSSLHAGKYERTSVSLKGLHQTCSQISCDAQVSGKVGPKDHNPASKGHAHINICQRYGIPAGDQERYEREEAVSLEAQMEVAFVDQVTSHDTPNDEKQGSGQKNPTRQKKSFAICLKEPA